MSSVTTLDEGILAAYFEANVPGFSRTAERQQIFWRSVKPQPQDRH